MNPYRELPSVNELVECQDMLRWKPAMARELIVSAAREVLENSRREISSNGNDTNTSFEHLVALLNTRLEQARRSRLGKVINATGIIIHTGLGRAPLSRRALDAIVGACGGYTSLEVNLETGKRGQRSDHVRQQLCSLTSAETATVVNNNAAALLITLGVLARGKQVIVSRGELIEIGGGFRLPEIIAASGAILREVGTTNKTRRSDVANAIGDDTGALLKIHPSNYHIAGFTHEVSIHDLAELGHKCGLPVIHDIGSGALFDWGPRVSKRTLQGRRSKSQNATESDTPVLPLQDEPIARRSIKAGADLVLFSGDKLLGGPQAGLIVGKRKYVEQIERTPMMRAMRVDKLTLAALSATLGSLEHPQQAARELPVWQMMTTTIDLLRRRGKQIAGRIKTESVPGAVNLVSTRACIGGGAVARQKLESVGLALTSPNFSEQALAQRLRTGASPVWPRLRRNCVVLDLRTVLPDEDELLVSAIISALGGD